MSPQQIQPREAGEIAANTKALIAGEVTIAIAPRKARRFDRRIAPTDRPVHGDAAERVGRGQRALHACTIIDAERACDVAPGTADKTFRERPDQLQEFIRGDREATVAIRLPL